MALGGLSFATNSTNYAEEVLRQEVARYLGNQNQILQQQQYSQFYGQLAYTGNLAGIPLAMPMVAPSPKDIKRRILESLRSEIDAWHGDVLRRRT